MSKDGTRVPYFLVGKDLTSSSKSTKPRPTCLYGYGGFEISLTPSYMAIAGQQWIEKGGIFALANIRGGGEFGPQWHQAALKENRPKAYEDFEACGMDLISSGVTTKEMLGISVVSYGALFHFVQYLLVHRSLFMSCSVSIVTKQIMMSFCCIYSIEPNLDPLLTPSQVAWAVPTVGF